MTVVTFHCLMRGEKQSALLCTWEQRNWTGGQKTQLSVLAGLPPVLSPGQVTLTHCLPTC